MKYQEMNKIFKTIEKHIEDLKEYENKEQFIDANFSQSMFQGEYDDNSIDLAYHYENMTKIKNDKDILPLFRYLLSNYA